MTFTKETGSKLGKKGVEAKKKHKEDLWAFLASGGARKYHELLDKQLDDNKLGKEQEKAMDRVEKLFPYVKARKTDITSGGEKILPQPLLLNVRNNNSPKEADPSK